MDFSHRTTWITVFASLGILLFFGILFFFLGRSNISIPGITTPDIFPVVENRPLSTSPITTTGTETLPVASGEKRHIIQITDEPALAPILDTKEQKILYFQKRTGHLLANTFLGKGEETISGLSILNMFDAMWSPNRKKVIALYQEGSVGKKFVMDAVANPKVSFLPQAGTSFSWSPDSSQIGWMQKQGENYAFITANARGSGQRQRGYITTLADTNASFLTNDTVSILPKTVSFFETPLSTFNLKTSTGIKLFSQLGLLASINSHPTTPSLAYSFSNRDGSIENLHVFDVKTGKDITLPIKTLAEKCAFAADGKTLFCGVPKEKTGGHFPEDWFQGKISFSDVFVRIRIPQNVIEVLPLDGGDFDATSLVITKDARRVFFIDKKTGFLYGLIVEQ